MVYEPAVIENRLIKKSNALIKAEFPFMTPQEYRIIGLAAAQLTVHDLKINGFPVLKVHHSNVTLDKRNSSYKELDEIAKSLTSKAVLIKNNEKSRKWVSLVTSCEIPKNSGFFYVEFHKDMADHLLELKSHFTQVPEWVLLGMKSNFSVRLYEVLRCHKNIVLGHVKKEGSHQCYSETENIGWRITKKIQFPKLYAYLGIDKDSDGKSYLRWDNCKSRLMPMIQKDFEKHSEFLFDWEPGKDAGRSWQYIVFTLYKNDSPMQLDLFTALDEYGAPVINQDDPDIIDVTPIPQITISQELIEKIPENQWDTPIGCKSICEQIAKEQDLNAVEYYIDYALKYPGGSNSFGKIIRFAYKNDFYGNRLKEIEMLKEAEAAEAEAAEKALEAARAMSDEDLEKAIVSEDPAAYHVWYKEGRGAKIEAKREVTKAKEAELNIKIDDLLKTDFHQFVEFVKEKTPTNKVDSGRIERWISNPLEEREPPIFRWAMQQHYDEYISKSVTQEIPEIRIGGRLLTTEETLKFMAGERDIFPKEGDYSPL